MSISPPIATSEQYLNALHTQAHPASSSVLAFYEHRLGIIGTNPNLMLMPIDDHLAHRGDGVFEAIKYLDGAMWEFDEHIERMKRSASGIYLTPPCSWEEVKELIFAVAVAGKEKNGTIRILLGRGPGGFGISPKECPIASLYIIANKFIPYPDAWYQKGLTGFKTTIPAKQGYLARIKNTNYLPNVLMMREALERGLDVPFCFTEEGYLAESAVANLCLINQQGQLVIPQVNNILAGTTLQKASELITDVAPHIFAKVTEQDIYQAKEVLLLGTSPICASVTRYEGTPIGNGTPGPIAPLLRARLKAHGMQHATPVTGLC